MKTDLLPYAISVGNRISTEYITNSEYIPIEPWGSEGQIYPSLIGIGLLDLFRVTNNVLFLRGAKAIIESNNNKQTISGGWPLYLGINGNGARFRVSDDIKYLTSNIEDLPSTVTALRLISEYQQLTLDKSFSESLDRGFQFLKQFWNDELGHFNEMLTGDILKLRANPIDYHIYAYQCVESLRHIYPDAEGFLKPLYMSVKDNFEAMKSETYPLLYGLHAAIISHTEGKSEYVEALVKKRIIEEIAINSIFSIPNNPGALGHHDGLRGICLEEGHIRNAIGVSLAMDFYDNATNTAIFRNTDKYVQIKKWIQSMYNDGKYYEFIDLKTGSKLGDGSAGFFLPLFWILETF